MHPGQQHVVAPVIEVRHAAFLGPKIAHRRRHDCAACSPRQHSRTATSASKSKRRIHGWRRMTRSSGCDRIDPKSEQGIVDPGPQRLDDWPRPVRQLAALHPQRRGAGVELRLAQDQRRGLGQRRRHEAPIWSAGCWPSESMVEHVREARRLRDARAVQHGRALAAVARQHAARAAPGRAAPWRRAPRRCRRYCHRPRPRPGSNARAPPPRSRIPWVPGCSWGSAPGAWRRAASLAGGWRALQSSLSTIAKRP